MIIFLTRASYSGRLGEGDDGSGVGSPGSLLVGVPSSLADLSPFFFFPPAFASCSDFLRLRVSHTQLIESEMN